MQTIIERWGQHHIYALYGRNYFYSPTPTINYCDLISENIYQLILPLPAGMQ